MAIWGSVIYLVVHNAWVTAGCQTLSWTNADLSPRNEHGLDPNIEHLSNIIKSGNRFVAYPNRKQTDIVLCTMNIQRQDWWTSIKKFCYSGHPSGHRVALVVHRAQKSVPDSAGEWPTFLPPPLESCSGTADVDSPNYVNIVQFHSKIYLIFSKCFWHRRLNYVLCDAYICPVIWFDTYMVPSHYLNQCWLMIVDTIYDIW